MGYVLYNLKIMIYQILIDRFNGGWTTPPKNENAFFPKKNLT